METNNKVFVGLAIICGGLIALTIFMRLFADNGLGEYTEKWGEINQCSEVNCTQYDSQPPLCLCISKNK